LRSTLQRSFLVAAPGEIPTRFEISASSLNRAAAIGSGSASHPSQFGQNNALPLAKL
jgi:hypothetical protein